MSTSQITHVMPSLWNNPNKVETANCMAYALNREDIGWAMPSMQSLGYRNFPYNTEGLKNIYNNTRALSGSLRASILLLQFAGLRRVKKHSGDPAKQHIIAFNGYHFYRLDGDGNWSHKNGIHPATNRTVNGEVISDIDTLHTPTKKYCPDIYREDRDTISLIAQGSNINPRKEGYIAEYRLLYNHFRQNAGRVNAGEVVYLSLPPEGFFISTNSK